MYGYIGGVEGVVVLLVLLVFGKVDYCFECVDFVVVGVDLFCFVVLVYDVG